MTPPPPTPGHDAIRELLGVYVLGALDRAEHDLVESHAASCSRCADEISDLRGAASRIDATQPRPPRQVWDRVATHVHRTLAPEVGAREVVEGAATDGLASGARTSADGAVMPRVAALRANTRLHERRIDQRSLSALDAAALRAGRDAIRALLWIETPADARNVLVAFVTELGGTVVPAELEDPEAIPVDISFGAGPPIVPSAPPLSVARIHLEEILPEIVEDARRAVAVIRERTHGR